MIDYKDIEALVEHFLDGDTSLDEERQLEAFFRKYSAELADMPEAIQIVAQMFAEFPALEAPVVTAAPVLRPQWYRWIGGVAAAAIAICILLYRQTGVTTQTDARVPPLAQSSDTLTVTISPSVDLIAEIEPVTDESLKKTKHKTENRARTQIPATKEVQELSVLTPETSNADSGTSMYCVILPSASMMPMHNDNMVHTVMMECEMSLLEEEFQRTERNRHTIEI